MKAIKLVKSKVTDINRMKIEEQKKAVRAGYDMDIIPSDLNTYGGEAKRLLEDLQSRNERMFLVTALFLNTAKTKQALDNAIFQTAGIAQKYNCVLKRLDYQQEEGLMAGVPLGVNHIPIKRALTTRPALLSSYRLPLQELFMAGESLYYGLNALSNNMIMVDRKKLKNPNGLILGTPGSGKSFAAKEKSPTLSLSRRMTLSSEIRRVSIIHWSMHLADRGHRKTTQQRHYEKLKEYAAKLEEYVEKIKICGEEPQHIQKQIIQPLLCESRRDLHGK